MGDPQRALEPLRTLATAHPTTRFGKVLKVMQQDAFLQMAWQKVRTNKGRRTAGVEGHTRDDVDEHGIDALAHDLATRHSRPQPVRRISIPKQGKPGQRRVQAAIARVLDALSAPLFRACSYGFRPGRSPIHALRHVARASRSGVTWIVEGDLARGVDSLPHSMILACLRTRIKDERVIDRIRRVLQAGVMEQGPYERTYAGAPPGGLCAPILMHSVLHAGEGWMEEPWQANAPVPQRTHPE
jgi:RNA-directed DNA polymerase